MVGFNGWMDPFAFEQHRRIVVWAMRIPTNSNTGETNDTLRNTFLTISHCASARSQVGSSLPEFRLGTPSCTLPPCDTSFHSRECPDRFGTTTATFILRVLDCLDGTNGRTCLSEVSPSMI